MFKKSRVALATLAAAGLTLTLAGPGAASSDFGGANTQTTGSLHCNDNDPGAEGIISARIKGHETRAAMREFRTSSVSTFVKAQILIGGVWYDDSTINFHQARLGVIRRSGGQYVKPWIYIGRGMHPRFGASVLDIGTYRIVFTSRLFIGGINYATLRTIEGTCTFA